MRLGLTACAVAVFLFGAFSFAQKGATAPSQPAISPVTVVSGVSARGFVAAPGSAFYATIASAQDRVFSLGTLPVAPTGSKSAAPLNPLAGTGMAGSLGDGGNALAAQLDLSTGLLYERSGIAVAEDGTIYIADTQNSTIRRVAGPSSTEPGVIRSVAGRWAPPQSVSLSRPLGIALDRAGNVYIADQSAGALDVLRPDGILEAVAQIASPATVAVRADGSEAYVASPETGSVIAVILKTKSLRVIEATTAATDGAQEPTCVADNSGGPSRPCPSGLAVDGAGNLFVADLLAGTVTRFDAATGGSSAVLTGLSQPGAIAFDVQGRDLFISEQGANRIVVAQALGAAVNTNISLAPTSAPFPNQPIAGISAAQQFTLTNNTGSTVSDLQISPAPPNPNGAAATPGDFATQSTSCLSTLAAGASCTISVAFTPTAIGARSSPLTVTDAAGDTASSSLSGTGDDYQLQLANGQLQEISVKQGQSTTFNLQVVALGVFGQNGEKVSLNCSSGLPVQTTCTANPSSGSPTVSTPAAFSVTFQTTSPSSAAQATPNGFKHLFRQPEVLAPALCLATLLGFGIAVRKRRWVRVTALVFSPACLLIGCHHHGPTATATPLGPTNILIQASAFSQNGTSLNTTRSLTVTLDVLK